MTTLKIALAMVVVFAGIGSSSIAQELEFKVEMFKVYAYDANGNEAPFVATQEISLKRKHSGACDGFNRCRCGVTAAREAGLPLNYNGLNLKMARSYYAFPRTSCQAGAVGIPHAHHVYTVRQCNGDGTALVYDDAGTYTRSVRRDVFVSVSGGGTMMASTGTVQHSARSRRGRSTQMTQASFTPEDRLTAVH